MQNLNQTRTLARHAPPSRKNAQIACSLVLLALGFCAASAAAQSHEQKQGDYTLRSSTVSSMTIDEKTAREHGIQRGADTGVLNIVVLKQSTGLPVAADVTVTARALTGRPESIQLKEVKANGMVSYTGTYSFVPREVLDFTISARPRAEKSPPEITMTFRDRIWR